MRFLLPAFVLAFSLPAFAGSPYVSADLGFGEAFNNGGGSPGVAYNIKAEGGYIASRDSWSRVEFGLGILMGGTSYRADVDGESLKYTTTLGPGMLLKLGYGYSLGEKMIGLWRVGAGLTSGSTSAEGSSESFLGPMIAVGYDLIVQTEGNFDLLAGAEVTHLSYDASAPVNMNIPAIRVGIRMRLGGLEDVQTQGKVSWP
jgi:hypothetical protein